MADEELEIEETDEELGRTVLDDDEELGRFFSGEDLSGAPVPDGGKPGACHECEETS